MEKEKILIIGGTGMLGKPVVYEFLKNKYALSILSRTPEKYKTQFPAPINWIKGDLKDKAKLKEILMPFDKVHLNLSVLPTESKNDFHTEEAGLDNLLEASLHAKIKRISYLSSLIQFYEEGDWWVLKMKRKAVEKIKNSTIPYFIFYPSNFMESIFHQYKFSNFLLSPGNPKHAIHWIASKDYSKQVVNAFRLNLAESKDFIVQGPEAIEVVVALKRFAKAYKGSSLHVIPIPSTPMKMAGMFTNFVDYGYHIITAINNYPETFLAKETWDLLGKPTVTIEEFAKNMTNESRRV